MELNTDSQAHPDQQKEINDCQPLAGQVFTPMLFEMYKVLKCNESRLPKNFPGRPFTYVQLGDYELAILCGKIKEVYQDIYLLNSWLIGKYGKQCWTEAILDERGKAMLEVIRGLVNTYTVVGTEQALTGVSAISSVEENSH